MSRKSTVVKVSYASGGLRCGHVADYLLELGEVERLGDGRPPRFLQQRGGVGGKGVAGAEDEPRGERGALASQLRDELPPAHARHPDVGDDDVEMALREQPQGFGAVPHAFAADAAAREEAEQRVAQARLVVDDEHGERAARRLGRRWGFDHGLLLPRIARQADAERRPATRLRFHGDPAAVLLHDAVTDRETEAGADSLGLRREERVEDLGADLGRSEEHTSELQSLAYLVCRLLLEKKK